MIKEIQDYIREVINCLKEQKGKDEKLYDKYSTLTLKDYNQALKCYHEGRIEVEEDIINKLNEIINKTKGNITLIMEPPKINKANMMKKTKKEIVDTYEELFKYAYMMQSKLTIQQFLENLVKNGKECAEILGGELKEKEDFGLQTIVCEEEKS